MREKFLEYYIDKIKKSSNNEVRDTTKSTPPHPCPLPPGERGLSISPPLRGGDEGEGDACGFTNERVSKEGFSAIEFSEEDFKETLLPCRLQRHMQALGAYGFLSRIKGKKYFLKHVPEGLRLLKEDISLAKDRYPELYDLVMSL